MEMEMEDPGPPVPVPAAFDTVPSPLSPPDAPVNWSAPFTPSSTADTNPSNYGSPSSSLVTSPSYQLSEHFAESPIRAESPASVQGGPAFGKLHFAGRHLGDISLHNGIPFLSSEGQKWIASRTGESAPLHALSVAPPRRHGVHPAFWCANTAHTEGMALPERHVVEEALDMFTSNPFKRIWPAVDGILFRQTIDAAYDTGPGRCSLEAVAARACIFSFLGLLSLHHMYPKSMPTLDSEECAVQAQHLLPQVLHETSLDGLQTCFMLVSHPPGCMQNLANPLRPCTTSCSVNCRRPPSSTQSLAV
jgi:hypothetical protein